MKICNINNYSKDLLELLISMLLDGVKDVITLQLLFLINSLSMDILQIIIS
jgi:hypothetical protein